MKTLLFASELSSDRGPGRFDLTEIPICVTGSWYKDGGRFSITREDLDDIVRNFEKRGNGQVVVDFEHASERPEVARGGPVPAAGWLTSLSIRKNGDGKGWQLWADVTFNRDAEKMIRDGRYKFFSPAIDWGTADKKTGRSKGATITSGALTNHPFLEELPAIQLSERAGKILDKMVVPVVDGAKIKVKIDAKHGDDEEELSDAEPTKSEVDGDHPSSHYLVTEDPQKPSTWHLRVKDKDGDADHRLMGAAWAALHGGYRGNKYEGPQKQAATSKLKALYKSEKMQTPAEQEASERFTQLPHTQKRNEISRAIAKGHGDVFGQFPKVENLNENCAVVRDDDGKLYRFAYAVGGDGKVRVGKPKLAMQQASDGGNMQFEEAEREVGDDEEQEYHVDGLRPDRGGREEAKRRAAKIDEPSHAEDTDEAEELREERALPRLRVRRMRSAGHHAVVDGEGKLRGFISHEDLTAAAREGDNGQGQATREVMRRTDDLMKRDDKMSYRQAYSQVLASDADLKRRYDREHHKVLL